MDWTIMIKHGREIRTNQTGNFRIYFFQGKIEQEEKALGMGFYIFFADQFYKL